MRRTLRALSGPIAALLALIIWVIAVPWFDVDLTVPTGEGNATITVGPGPIVTLSVIPALLGWASIAVLERLAPRRAATLWTAGAVLVLLLSLVPLLGLSASQAVTLGLMHLVVGAVIIAVMKATSPAPTTAEPAPAPA